MCVLFDQIISHSDINPIQILPQMPTYDGTRIYHVFVLNVKTENNENVHEWAFD